MQIRDMTPNDFPQVMEMEKRHQDKPWPQYAFGQAIRLGHSCMVAEQEGKILGYVVWNRGHGRTICATNSKAAVLLYRAWFDDAAKKKVEMLWGETSKNNVEAIAMLVRFGFTKSGTRPNFFGAGLDALVWTRSNPTEASVAIQGRPNAQLIEPV